MIVSEETINDFIKRAIEEDVRDGDHSSLAAIPNDAKNKAKLLVKDKGILAGIELAKHIFRYVDEGLKMEILINDGQEVEYGDIAFYVEGKAQSILTAERLVLNCMQRMSGIATVTNKVAKLLDGTNTKVLDTRKTTPLIRFIEKWAVKIGGGENHRFGLFDMIMLKDNHIDYAGGIENAIKEVKTYLQNKNLDLKIEVETRNLEEVQEVLKVGGIDRIMLDNFTPDQIREALRLIDGKFETEASGGITPESIRAYAETGVDYISMGMLTHSIKSLDLSLKAV